MLPHNLHVLSISPSPTAILPHPLICLYNFPSTLHLSRGMHLQQRQQQNSRPSHHLTSELGYKEYHLFELIRYKTKSLSKDRAHFNNHHIWWASINSPTSSYQSWPTINEHRVRTTWTNRSRPDHHECSTDSSTWAFLSRVPSSSSAIPVATPKNSPSLIRSSTNVPAALRRSKNASTKTRIRCLPVVVCFGVLPSPC